MSDEDLGLSLGTRQLRQIDTDRASKEQRLTFLVANPAAAARNSPAPRSPTCRHSWQSPLQLPSFPHRKVVGTHVLLYDARVQCQLAQPIQDEGTRQAQRGGRVLVHRLFCKQAQPTQHRPSPVPAAVDRRAKRASDWTRVPNERRACESK